MPVLEELERMGDERFRALYQALTTNGFGPLDGEVAKALKFRPQAVRKLDLSRRAQTARRLIEKRANAELCFELFGTYLVRERQELVTAFLDLTDVPHKDGMIEGDAAPDEAKIDAAVKDLDERFETADVTLYLALAAEQWPSSEAVLAAWRGRA